MADQEHLRILGEGVEAWNRWREENPEVGPDLSRMTFQETNLDDVNLDRTYLQSADFLRCSLNRASLSNAFLNLCNFRSANLYQATLNSASLIRADFSGAILANTDFSEAVLGETLLINVDLSKVKGLETCKHRGPSTLDHRTLTRSGHLPLSFLRGVGLPDTFIDYLPSLLNQPLQFYSVFISYSHKDEEFVKRLHADLQDKGVRCWYAPEDLPTGARLRPSIDEAIRIHDKLLIVLSENSVNSQWVEHEVENALEKEREQNRTVLFPIKIDESVMGLQTGWPDFIKLTRNIGDFCQWKNFDVYQKSLAKLLKDLKASEQS